MPSPFTDEQIDFMKADLESNFGYTKLIDTVRKKIEAEGKNFDEEFHKWQLKQKKERK